MLRFPAKIRHAGFSAKKSHQSKKVVLVRHFAAFNLRRVFKQYLRIDLEGPINEISNKFLNH